MKCGMPQVRRGGGVPPEEGLGGAGGIRQHIAGGWAAHAEERAAPCVFAMPQQILQLTEKATTTALKRIFENNSTTR